MRVIMRHRRGSALALFLLSGCWLALGGSRPVGADADAPSASPALEACQRFATRHYQQVSPERFVAVRLLEEDANARKYQDKVGSQFVATVLSGRGIWQEKTGGPSNVHFTCLLENPDKPVFIELANDGPRDPADVCWDGFEPSGWGKLTQCLQDSLKRAEAALADSSSKAAKQAGESLDKIAAKQTLQESDAQWIKYRDIECARRQAFVAGRNHPDIGELTCKIHKTAERIADMNFDE
jgi:uncharacterized protein YecT (DUF1311 family)